VSIFTLHVAPQLSAGVLLLVTAGLLVTVPVPVPCFFAVSSRLGGVLMNASALDVPPPGADDTTVTSAAPGLAMSAAAIAAVSLVVLTNVVGRGVPFHCSVEAGTKLPPVTVSVNPRPPAVALLGTSMLSVGMGFPAMIAMACAVEVPPPGAGVKT